MNIENSLLVAITSKKGQIATITTERPLKGRKGMPVVIKTSTFQTRLGITYDNLSGVITKRASGDLPEDNQGLAYGEWALFPYLIKTKNSIQLRCNSFKSSVPTVTEYMCDGELISRDDAQRLCLASEFKTDSRSDVFNIKIDSIIKLV